MYKYLTPSLDVCLCLWYAGVYMCSRVCGYIEWGVNLDARAHAWSLHLMLGVFPDGSSPYILRQGLLLSLEF